MRPLRQVHQKLAEKLAPLADEAGFALAMGLETATNNRDPAAIRQTLAALAGGTLASLQAALDLGAESNLMLGLLVEAADLPSADLVPPVKDRFNASAGHIDKAVAALKDIEISKLAAALISIGEGSGNIFILRQKEFAGGTAGAKLVTENRALAAALEKEVEALGTRSEAAAATAAAASQAEISRERVILVALALASLGTALAVGWFYVGRGVARRLTRLQHSVETVATMRSLAAAAKQIGDVLRLIKDIAEQTNLLALNATIDRAIIGRDAPEGRR